MQQLPARRHTWGTDSSTATHTFEPLQPTDKPDLDSERVRTLIRSKELAAKYGESPVAIAFQFGAGDVLHMISHYYLQ
jgi:hypothetical protein